MSNQSLKSSLRVTPEYALAGYDLEESGLGEGMLRFLAAQYKKDLSLR